MGECIAGTEALRSLLDTEYAFGTRARTSIRTAFLEYLAEDSVVLQPAPTAGRAFYGSAQDNADKLEWYPALADLSGSGDLGFTAGPWIYTVATGGVSHGHFLTIWKRDAACRWQIECDAGVSHAAPTGAEPKLSPDQASYAPRSAPLPSLIVDHALDHAMQDFQNTARQEGIAPALRTYARTADFRLYIDGEAPMGLSAANRHFYDRTLSGTWMEDVRTSSADVSLAYSVGVLGGTNRPGSHAYVQIWQYAPKVANWGLRLLLINSLATSLSK
ncbi:MAG: Cif family virulence factor [Steroidobacteraceae bacterium]